MGLITSHMSVSLDGFVAGPDQSADNPLGVGGMSLHHWHFAADEPGHEVDAPLRDHLVRPGIGAYVMGRKMFGPIRGEWTDNWRGWWGDEPPYHAPVFVLTHFARESIEMQGGTTFHFVTDGIDSAISQARQVSGEKDVDIAGGASTVRQAINAGLLDELLLDISPVLLGRGEPVFDETTAASGTVFEPVETVHSPWATHIRYRLTR